MARTRIAILGGFALAVSALVPIGSAVAQEPAEPDDTTVEESTTGSYIVVMDDEPLIALHDQEDLDSPEAQADAEEIVESHEEVLEDSGASADDKVQSFTNALNGFSAVISHEEAESLAAKKGVQRVLPDELEQVETDSSPKFLGLTGRKGAWASGATGEGVVVGVIDTGVWPEHPSFADDGSYAAPSIPPLDGSVFSACDFGNTAHNADDAPFTCNNKLVGARQMLATYRALIGADPDEFDSARDDDGHGTHTASTAAGNAGVAAELFGRQLGEMSGIAPRAHVVAYKGLGNLGGFGSDLAASIDQAVADGVDVINYSVGGGASLAGADDIAFLFAADAGVFVATSAGNSGPGAGTVGGPGTVPWITTVGASTQPRFYEGEVELISDDDDDDRRGHGKKKGKKKGHDRTSIEGASITPGTDGALPLVDAEFAGGDLCIPGTLDPSAVAGNIVLCRRGAIARSGKSLAVSQAGGAGMVMYNNSDDDNLHTDSHWVPSVHVDLTEGLEVKDYIAATADPEAQISTGDTSKWKSAPSMTIFSSRGPDVVAEDLIKPDITAPGHQILAGNTPFPDPDSTPPGELFQAIAGTSMSSPHVAGMFALLKQVHPEWSAAQAKSAIMTTADQDVVDNDRVTPADPFEMGAGHLDPGRVGKKGSAFRPGLTYDAGLFEYAAFTCGADLGVFTPGSCDFLDSIGMPSDASDLNVPSIGIADLAGSQTVVRTVTSVADKTVKWRVRVDEPAGYDVAVSPSVIRLAPGESATFEVTITNDGTAPVGEWSFGSLTWRGKGYTASSPIAVKGALFAGPDAATGEGVDGAGSFEVGFGYTGDYTAAPHGLAPNAPVDGVIHQDPDQTYPSADDTPDGVNKIPFPVSGSAMVRWELVIPGDDDIDLFLEDSGGTIIAASTAGGTNELIELTLPADDTYTMVVHGWSVPSEPLPYTLSFWDVPLASGGNLSVDSAPTSATAGESGTVEYSWSGAATGLNLGAISHSDAGGLLGLTVVEITAP